MQLDSHDHRALGERLDLFHFAPEAPGMVYWHPRGWAAYRALEEEVRRRLRREGFEEVRTPQLMRREVWERSGHWDQFPEGLFTLGDAALKPVNCPGHLALAARRSLSWRDLPLRYAELGLVHRDEPSGALHGLFRLRQFTQDDGHILLPEQSVPAEVERFLDSLAGFYRRVGFDEIGYAFSTRPAARAGSDAQWDRAEAALRAALGDREHALQPGEGAFYGPKIELVLRDRLGRRWQCGTIQLDLVLPERFGVRYADGRGAQGAPAMLHRAMLGSLERFFGILLEHHAGRLPGWLAPEQVVVLPVSGAALPWAREVHQRLVDAGLRARLDDRPESLAKRVREAHALFFPHVAVVGEREQRDRRVSLRDHGRDALPLDGAIAAMRRACAP